jgi:hypothetical protein
MMNSLTDTFIWVTALSGAVCLMTWPLFSTRAAILTVQLGVAVSFGLHYTLLDADTAAIGNAIGALQILLSLFFSNTARLRWAGYMPIPLMLVLGAVSWNGPSSLFATTGAVFQALGRAQLDERLLRTLVLIGTGFWLVHDILVWSPVAIVDAISLGVGCLTLLRDRAAAVRSPMAAEDYLSKPLSDTAPAGELPASPRAPSWVQNHSVPSHTAFQALNSRGHYET